MVLDKDFWPGGTSTSISFQGRLPESTKKDLKLTVRYLIEENIDEIMVLVKEMIPFFMEHNSEVTALDLLLEVD